MHKSLLNSPLAFARPAIWQVAGSAAIVLAMSVCATAQVLPTAELAATRSAIESADHGHQETDDLNAQIAELNVRETERGLVVTLDDMLFETNRAKLKGSAASDLEGLSAFLKRYPDRNLIIEGHADNIGSDDYNYDLSQRQAETIRSYLISRGISPSRMSASGKGEGSPVANNDSPTGRRLNRRVEVIIVNTVTALR